MIDDHLFKDYKEDLTKVTDRLSLAEAMRSSRTGTKKFRDHFVFLKMAWTESLSYFAIVQSVVIFTALVPNSVENVNEFLRMFHIPYAFPIVLSSVASFLLIFLIFVFGIISFRFFGLARRANEVSSLYSPGYFMMWKQIKEMKESLEEIKNKLEKHE